MDEKVVENKGEGELDFRRLFDVLVKKAWLIGIVAVIAAVVVFLGTLFFVPPKSSCAAVLLCDPHRRSQSPYSGIHGW